MLVHTWGCNWGYIFMGRGTSLNKLGQNPYKYGYSSVELHPKQCSCYGLFAKNNLEKHHWVTLVFRGFPQATQQTYPSTYKKIVNQLSLPYGSRYFLRRNGLSVKSQAKLSVWHGWMQFGQFELWHHLAGFLKNGYPQIVHFFNRVVHEINHQSIGCTPFHFGNPQPWQVESMMDVVFETFATLITAALPPDISTNSCLCRRATNEKDKQDAAHEPECSKTLL